MLHPSLCSHVFLFLDFLYYPPRSLGPDVERYAVEYDQGRVYRLEELVEGLREVALTA